MADEQIIALIAAEDGAIVVLAYTLYQYSRSTTAKIILTGMMLTFGWLLCAAFGHLLTDPDWEIFTVPFRSMIGRPLLILSLGFALWRKLQQSSDMHERRKAADSK